MILEKVITSEGIIYHVNLNEEDNIRLLENLGVDVLNEVREIIKEEVNSKTDEFILNKFKEVDEELSDIISEQNILEGKFYIKGIDPQEVKNRIFLILTGQDSEVNVLEDLKIPASLKPDFYRALEIAKLIYWKELIWRKEASLEEELNTLTLQQLLNLNVEEFIKEAYYSEDLV